MSLIGTQLGHYTLTKLIGSGGMGEVYLAEDARIGQQVAIKVSRTEASPYPDANSASESARLFQREARAIAQLDHPRILPLYGYGEEQIRGETLTYIVMPYRREGSLVTWLRQRANSAPLNPQDVAAIVTQTADALQYAHEHNVIHQDVKPANFLVRNRSDASTTVPDLLLTDFGIAKLSSATSHSSHAVRGTAAYMAPEQWIGDPVPATDQYALAVMAYELLTGRPPFQGRQEQLMYAHVNTLPQPPSTLNPRLSSDIDRVLLYALAKKPEERFRSIAAFANAFSQAVQSGDAPTVIKPMSSNPVPGTMPALAPATIITSNSNAHPGNVSTTGSAPNPVTPPPNYAAIQPPVQQKRHSSTILFVSIICVLLIILASFGVYFVQNTGKQNNNNANTQALNATGTAGAIAATTQANNKNATATAINTSPYPPPGAILALNDPLSDNNLGYNWNEGTTSTGSCGFTGGAYQVSSPITPDYHACAAQNTNFSNFAYEMDLTIIAGNCGAITFRGDISAKHYYFFRICQDGSYDLLVYEGSGYAVQTLVNCDTPCSNPRIHSGLNQPNLLAVVANNNNIDLYVNHQLITRVIGNTYSQGQIGVAADNDNSPTEVIFSNAKVWTF
ncbi:MAG TPA: serine/threonine-protein kinase [Ktedonobacteraceae bacterium]|nr:serine/threonine-protein kinase [Ktedonobacteraceae bacterium]